MRRFLISLAVVLSCASAAFAQKVALKTNLPGNIISPNLALEVALGRKWTLDTQYGTNFFYWTNDVNSPKYTTKKFSHWMVQPELRYWNCEVFNGLFFGLHAHGGQMNVGQYNIPLFILQNKDNVMKNNRYEGWFAGAGVSIGYHWILSNRFSLEASVGAGYAYIHYDKFKCATCGERLETNKADYIGPTKAALSLVYMFK